MMFDIAELVADGSNIRNVFSDNSVGTAKQPCLVDKRTKQQGHHIGGYKTKTQEYFTNTLVIGDTCSYGLHCGRQQKGKFYIAFDWDIYDRETGLDDEPTERLLGSYQNICGDNDGHFNTSTEGNSATLLDITVCEEFIRMCDGITTFKPLGYKLEVQVDWTQVIPPSATPCKKRKIMGERRKFVTHKPFKVVLPDNGNLYQFVKQLLGKAPKKVTWIITPPPSDDEAAVLDPSYDDMMLNGIGNRKLDMNIYLRLGSVWKSNGGSYETWDRWSRECANSDSLSDPEHHVRHWEECRTGAEYRLKWLEELCQSENPAYYVAWKKQQPVPAAVSEIVKQLAAETKQIKKSNLTLDILNRGIRDTIDACYKKMERLKFCKNQWYYCRSETNLWECVKNPNLYMVRIVQNEINLLIASISADICNSAEKQRDELELERKKVLGHYPAIAGTPFQSNAIKFLCDLLLDNKFADKLDANKGFIAFENGILNFRSGMFVQGLLPEHYITFTLGYKYKKVGGDVDKEGEVWKQFKKVLNNSDTELDYFMSLVGHAFTGESANVKHMYFMIDGSGDSRGDNGKTFIFKIINQIMGAYVAKPKSSLLEKNNMKTHKQIVGLKGKRFVYMEEFPDKALNVDLLKELADGGAMENEIMFGTTETINIMAMFFVLSNHTPNLDANESAGYNRYKEISFCSHFDRTGDRKVANEAELEYIADTTLDDTIVRDHSGGVLELIIQYAMRYYKSGIPRTPMRFLKAELKTKKANDEFLEWFEEFIEGTKDDRIAEKKIIEMTKLDAKKVRKGMLRLGYKYDKDLSGIGKDLTTGNFYKGGYVL